MLCTKISSLKIYYTGLFFHIIDLCTFFIDYYLQKIFVNNHFDFPILHFFHMSVQINQRKKKDRKLTYNIQEFIVPSFKR